VSAIVTAAVLDVSGTMWGTIFAALTVVALLVFVFARELANAAGAPLRHLARSLMAVILPLLLAFAVTAVTRLTSMVQLP
jgi:hypothetical protein